MKTNRNLAKLYHCLKCGSDNIKTTSSEPITLVDDFGTERTWNETDTCQDCGYQKTYQISEYSED